MEEAGTLPNSYYEASITLISKLDKDITREVKRQTTIYYEYEILNKILANQIQQYARKN